MDKKFKIATKIYSIIIAFFIFFYMLMLGASGHKMSFTKGNYWVLFHFLSSILLLNLIPIFRNTIAKKILSTFIIISLIISFSLAVKHIIIDVYSENLETGFTIFSTIITVLFSYSVAILILKVFNFGFKQLNT